MSEQRLTTHHSPLTLDYLVLLAAQVAVGSAAILARTGLDAGLNPLALAAWRLTLASAILVVGLQLRSSFRPAASAPLHLFTSAPLWRDLILLTIAGLCLGLHFATWFASLARIPVARSTLLVCTSPVFAGLAGAVFLRHRLARSFWIGLIVAGIGAYMVTASGGRPSVAHAGSTLAGDLLAVLGAVCIAAYLLLAESLLPRLGSARLVAWTYSMAAATLWPMALLTVRPEVILPRTSGAWFSIISMALVPQLLGHTAMNWSLHRFPAGLVSAATLLEPAIAAALAWWIFGERVTVSQAIGGLILLCGVGLALRLPANVQKGPQEISCSP